MDISLQPSWYQHKCAMLRAVALGSFNLGFASSIFSWRHFRAEVDLGPALHSQEFDVPKDGNHNSGKILASNTVHRLPIVVKDGVADMT